MHTSPAIPKVVVPALVQMRCVACRVSGVRVVARGVQQAVAGIDFQGYGSSCSEYPHHYMTAAAAIGGTKQDVDVFLAKLRERYAECRKSIA
jgi:O-phospho-L-seryl-tRNASec:L-selenocysteinyl-tRNA synthase